MEMLGVQTLPRIAQTTQDLFPWLNNQNHPVIPWVCIRVLAKAEPDTYLVAKIGLKNYLDVHGS